MPDTEFSRSVLDWFERCGRTHLPWQQDISPYRVWVSEIMLQQTQVNTVIPYFERFMQAFPSVAVLARADEDQVLHLWTGLGYYARARNLHKTAAIVQQQFNGVFPDSVAELEALPGIGRSTAGAILSLSMQIRAPILDGNVKRVLARYLALKGWTGHSKTQQVLWQHAERFTPQQRVAHYTQAMMDLGATLCTRSQPQCERCPLQQTCAAYQAGAVALYPHPKPKRSIPSRHAYFLVLKNPQGEILLEKRPAQGIWGGLWSLPQDEDRARLVAELEHKLNGSIETLGSASPLRHTFSHFHLTMQPLHAEITSPACSVMESGRWHWYHPQKLATIGLAAPIKRLLEKL